MGGLVWGKRRIPCGPRYGPFRGVSGGEREGEDGAFQPPGGGSALRRQRLGGGSSEGGEPVG